MKAAADNDLFTRHPGNPIITVDDLPYRANSVFNPGATQVDGETVLLLRVEDRRGLSHFTVARSANGLDSWRVDSSPTLLPAPDTHPAELWGIEDARITYVEEERRWIVAYTAYSQGGPLVALAATSDFAEFERLGPVMAPEDKDAALFPIRFQGRWALIHRPVPKAASLGAHMWISFSPDMKHWGDHGILLRARQGAWWDAGKIGLSPQPLQTSRGWLILYHGVRNTPAGCLYRLGLALLDSDDPRVVLRRSSEWVFAPQESYERAGDVPDVVFPCGWTLAGDHVRLYYGAADTSIGVATASLAELLDWLDANSYTGQTGGPD